MGWFNHQLAGRGPPCNTKKKHIPSHPLQGMVAPVDGGFFAVKPSGRGEDGGVEDGGMKKGRVFKKNGQCMYPLKHTSDFCFD